MDPDHRGVHMRTCGIKLAVCGVLPCLAVLPLRAGPPFIRHEFTGDLAEGFLGYAIVPLGDLDGDSVGDYAVSAPNSPEAGRVLIISGLAGGVLRVLESSEPTFSYGGSLAAPGDLDQDDVTDLVITGSGLVELRSGRTGDLIKHIEKPPDDPQTVWAAGDVDEDGSADFAVAHHGGDEGSLTLHSGRTAEVLWTLAPEGRGDDVARSVAMLDDLDGDMVRDLAVGAPARRKSLVGLPPEPGKVFILSGKNGSEILRLHGDSPGDAFGTSLAALSDVDGDAVRELAVASAFHPLGGSPGAGRVNVFSGASGKLLWSRRGSDAKSDSITPGFEGDQFGTLIASAGDADGDGFDDHLVRAARTSFNGERLDDSGRVYLHSGGNGELLAVYEGERPDTFFGWNFSGIGDLDGDGRSEFAVAATLFGLPADGSSPEPLERVGKVYVLGYDPGTRLLRGDASFDGRVNLTDVIVILEALLRGGETSCEAALDVDRSLAVDLTDAVRILSYFFTGDDFAPEPPFPECGRLLSFRENLSCASSGCQ